MSPMPATAQEKSVDIIVLRSFSQMVVQGIDLIDYEDNMSTATGTSKSQTDYEDSKSGKHSTNSVTKDGAIPLLSEDYMQGDNAKNVIRSPQLKILNLSALSIFCPFAWFKRAN